MFENLVLGFGVALQPVNVLYCIAGVVMGTAVGVLPGLGPLAAMAMLLPLTYGLEPIGSLIMLAGIYYGSQYGGSTTAILINLPGEAASAVTTLDGHQMALKGRAGPALAAAALASFFAGTVATLLIALIARPLTSIALSFGPAEYVGLMVLGLISSIALASGSLLKALAMICLGLLLGLTGTDTVTGATRFTFGVIDLQDGIDFVALAAGIYGIGEILRTLESRADRTVVTSPIGRLWPSRADLKRIVAPTLRGTGVGSILGVLPGGGALLASFMAYNLEKKASHRREEFGHGAIEGVAAPEAANNAGAQTSFVPMLALGLPSNVVMAMMIGAMIMHGITPGPNVISSNPDLFWGLIASMWIGNAILVLLNLPLIGVWISLLRVPRDLLGPAIIVFCCIGVYSVGNNATPVYLIAIAGIVGYVLSRLGCEPAPFILGFILGPMLEVNLRRALLISGGSFTEFLTRPISATLFGLSAVVLLMVSRPAIASRRGRVFVE